MKSRKKSKFNGSNIYEAEESDAEEDKQAGQRYDNVDNFQYELPEDFEDEEIDEEMAFTEEDKQKMAKIAQKTEDADGLDSEEPLTRDDFSDDDSEADELYGKPAVRGIAGAPQEGTAQSGSDVEDIFADLGSDEESEQEQEQEEEESEEEEATDLEALRKTVEDTLGPAVERKRKARTALQDEAVPESQYNLPAGGELGELTLADMLAHLGPQEGKLSKAEKQLKQLAKKAQAVEPPLPGPIRTRKERQAGYEETKRDITKWTPIVRVNREAPTLVFANPKHNVAKTSSTAALAAKFKPESKMEAEVAAMLKAAGAQNELHVEEAEEALALQAVSAEDLAKRKDELAKMRSLLFRHEEKSKHMSKIKSKDYHRRMKKSARLKAEKAGELEDKDFIRLQAEKAEFERAKERLTLKHRNTSQWARRALKRGVDVHDDGKKEAIAEQLRLGQELRRKVDRIDTVAGSDDDTDTGAETSSSESEDEEGAQPGKRGLSRKAAGKLQSAAAGILEEGSDEDEEGSKGLFALPFMKRAQEKRKQAAQDEARQLLAELDGQASEEKTASQGRRNFGLAGGVQANDAGIEAELLDPDSGSDMDEDAEAKLLRLRQAAGNNRNASQDATAAAYQAPSQKQSKGRKAKQKSRAAAAEQQHGDEDWQGIVAVTEGPTSIESNPPGILLNGNGNVPAVAIRDGDVEQSEQPAQNGVTDRASAAQIILQSRAEILSPQAKQQKGKAGPKSAGKRKPVSIGPLPHASAAADGESSAKVEKGEVARPAFIGSKAFSGERVGYRFGKGKQGLGYYQDRAAKPTGGAAAKRRRSEEDTEAGGTEVDDMLQNIATDGAGDLALHNDADTGNDLTQRELIARAFAGDNVAAEFEAEKEAEAERELPKIEAPSVLPGWGAWASSQKEPKWLVAAKLKVERQKEAARAGRKDAKLKAVSLSERHDKKASKYNSTALPYPYTSKEAFEGSMRQPLGSDFNSQHSFREMTKPAIIKSSGVIIQPLKYSEGVAEEQRKVQKTKSGTRQAVAKVSGGMAQPQRKRRK